MSVLDDCETAKTAIYAALDAAGRIGSDEDEQLTEMIEDCRDDVAAAWVGIHDVIDYINAAQKRKD